MPSLTELFAKPSARKPSISEVFSPEAPAASPSPLEELFKNRPAPADALPLPDVMKFIPRDHYFDMGDAPAALTEETKGVAAMIDRMDHASPRMHMFVENARDMHVVISELDGVILPGAGVITGFNSHEAGHAPVIGINTDSPHALRSTTEEFVHMYQDVDMLGKNYTPQDAFMWQIGIEAQAKLTVAVEAVHQKHDGDPALYNKHALNEDSAEHRTATYLNERVEADGIEALSDPEVLNAAFNGLTSDFFLVNKYFHMTHTINDAFKDHTGADTLTGEDFARTFGHIVGDDPRNNFLTGTIQSRDDLIGMLPDKGGAHAWLTGEDAAPATISVDRDLGLGLGR